MPSWKFTPTNKKELVQLTDKLSQDEKIRREIWKELKEEGKLIKRLCSYF